MRERTCVGSNPMSGGRTPADEGMIAKETKAKHQPFVNLAESVRSFV
jgi:hypothetical protein